MRAQVPRIHAAGAELVIVGNGTPDHARGFIEDYAIETPVLTDPSRAVYAALDTRRGTMSPRVLLHALRAIRKGFFQHRVLGDGAQTGGVFIVLPGGEIAYRYVSAVPGDHPPPLAIVEALERATGAR